MTVREGVFEYADSHCVLPAALVVAYVLAMCASGGARRILFAGFDGYPAGDPRNAEMESILASFEATGTNIAASLSITPTKYKIGSTSVYAMARG